MAIRTTRFEIRFPQPKEERISLMNTWRGLCRQVQEAANFIWRQWLVWHVQNETELKLAADIARFRAWEKAPKKTRGKRPKWTVQAMPPELSKHVYRGLCDRFPDLHSRCRTLLQQKIAQGINSRKSARGSLPGWAAILFCQEGVPGFIHEQPIPFDCRNSPVVGGQNMTFLPPLNKREENWRLQLSLEMVVAENAKGVEVNRSKQTIVELVTKTRRAQGQAAHLEKILSGQYKFCGSSIVCVKTKWYALVTFNDNREVEKLASEKVAILRPGKTHPWSLRVDGRTHWLGGRGEYVATKRRQLTIQRRSRQNGYRHAGSANKGHGRNRALGPIFRMKRQWRSFVQAANHALTKQVIDRCKKHGVGRVIYLQPDGLRRERRFLSTAGKCPDIRESTLWDWYQVAKQMYKADSHGIEVKIVKKGDGNDSLSMLSRAG